MNTEDVIRHLRLQPHPEGGFFRETYRSADVLPPEALPASYPASRSISTAIYFLLPGQSFSSFHRLRSDEFWHFYGGAPAHLHLVHPDGRHERIAVGSDLAAAQKPQVLIPNGCWFAARCCDPQSYTLLGCTVAPGFDFADFELARREELTARFPEHSELINSFTRS